MTSSFRRPDVRRAKVFFPSGLTLGNLFFGVFAIVAASRGQYEQAGWYVVLGGVCDAFDGRVARATNTGGRFGEELDSLVDAITFGLAPAMIMYFAVLNRDGWDWVWAFLFSACAVLRLARFNIEQAGTAKTYFQGLPSPAAGMTLATYYWFSQTPLYTETVLAALPWHVVLRFVMAILSFLMVSNVPYPVLPPIGFRSVRSVIGSAIVIAMISAALFLPKEFFFPCAVVYVGFGLARGVLLGLVERRQGLASHTGHIRDENERRRNREPRLGGVETVGNESPPRRKRRRRRGSGGGGGGGAGGIRTERSDRQLPPILPSSPRQEPSE